jgi:hypothetical protein
MFLVFGGGMSPVFDDVGLLQLLLILLQKGGKNHFKINK